MALGPVLLVFFVLSPSIFAAGATAIPGNPQNGMEIFKARGCAICHSINRVGGTVGPDLTQVTVRRTDERLVNWLRDPASLLKDTDMPKVPWKDEQDIPAHAYLPCCRQVSMSVQSLWGRR